MTTGDKVLAILREHGGELSTDELARRIWPDCPSWIYPTRRSHTYGACAMLEKYGILARRVETHRHAYANHVAYWRIQEAEA